MSVETLHGLGPPQGFKSLSPSDTRKNVARSLWASMGIEALHGLHQDRAGFRVLGVGFRTCLGSIFSF